MLDLKKIVIAAFIFSSNMVFANPINVTSTAGYVTIPCSSPAWDFGVQVLYLKPSYSNFNYFGTNIASGTAQFFGLNYNWGWGFKVEGSYLFSTGNDLNFNWSHYNQRTSSLVPDNVLTALGVPVNSVLANIEPKWDAVNLELGQRVDFSEFKRLHYYAGFQYARVDTNALVLARGDYLNISSVGRVQYNGFGPRMGADFTYRWNNGFSIYAESAGALLVGTSSLSGRSSFPSVDGATAIRALKTAIVPALEAKLGTTYTYTMSQGVLSLDAGWMWLEYFSSENMGSTLSKPMLSNFALQGPYVGLKWIGNFV